MGTCNPLVPQLDTTTCIQVVSLELTDAHFVGRNDHSGSSEGKPLNTRVVVRQGGVSGAPGGIKKERMETRGWLHWIDVVSLFEKDCHMINHRSQVCTKAVVDK